MNALSEAELKPSIGTAVEPATILTKTALKKTFTGKTTSKSVKKCKVVAGSKSQTTLKQEQQNQATTNKQQQQQKSDEGHVHSTQKTAKSEDALKKYDLRISNHAEETLENDNKGELPYRPYQNENKNRVKQQGNYETENEPTSSENYTVTSRGEIGANDRDGEPKNLGLESLPITNLDPNDAVSFNNTIASVNAELCTLSTSPTPIDKDLSLTDICSANYVSEKQHHQQTANHNLFKSDGHTTMIHKSNIDTPLLENKVSNTLDSGNCGENANNMCQIDIDQDLDQMVPCNCETTTVMLVSTHTS